VNGAHLYVVGHAPCDVDGNIGRAHRVALAGGAYDASWAPPNARVNNEGFGVGLAFDVAGNAFVAGPGGASGVTVCQQQVSVVTVEKFLISTGAPDPAWTVPAEGSGFLLADGGSLYTAVRIHAPSDAGLDSTSIVRRSAVDGMPISGWTIPAMVAGSNMSSVVATPEGLWVAGRFSRINGEFSPGLAQLNPSTGARQPSFGASTTYVGFGMAVATLSDGKFLLGGQFDYVNGVQRSNLARLDANGQFDATWTTQADNEVWRLAIRGKPRLRRRLLRLGRRCGAQLRCQLDATTGEVDTGWDAKVDEVCGALRSTRPATFTSVGLFLTLGRGSPGPGEVFWYRRHAGRFFRPPFAASCFPVGTQGSHMQAASSMRAHSHPVFPADASAASPRRRARTTLRGTRGPMQARGRSWSRATPSFWPVTLVRSVDGQGWHREGLGLDRCTGPGVGRCGQGR